MNTGNVNAWLASLPTTQRYLAATVLTFGTLAVLGATGVMSPKQVRTIALMIGGLVFMYRAPTIMARMQPRTMPPGLGPH